MKILLTGKDGQVGFALHKKLTSLGEVIATNRDILDLSDPQAIKIFFNQTQPDIIINPAAYTQVDKAESEKLLAHQINVEAPQVLAEKASELHIPIIHFSTDYVFDGLKNEPYLEEDKVNPQSIYAKTKCDGEAVVRQHKKHVILRTSWVFGSHSNNFLKTILRLAQEKDALSIVNDQKGSPASASMLADVTFKIAQNILNNKDFKDYGTYHLTSTGETNWYEYACFIVNEAMRLGFHSNITPDQIKAISTDAYPTVAKRPLNSRLSTEKIRKTFMLELPHWEDEVRKVLKDLIH